MAENWFARKLAERAGQAPAMRSGAPLSPAPPQQLQRAARGPVVVPDDGQAPPIWITGNDGKPMLNALAWKGNRKNGYMKNPSAHVCPECGSTNYFPQRGGVMTKEGRAPAAEHCYDCGYNPMFTPFGGGQSLTVDEQEA